MDDPTLCQFVMINSRTEERGNRRTGTIMDLAVIWRSEYGECAQIAEVLSTRV